MTDTDGMPVPGTRAAGVLCALGSAACFALLTPIGKSLVGTLPPIQVSGLTYLFCGLAMLAAGGWTARMSFGGPLRPSDLPRLAASICLGGLVAPLFLFLGLQRMAAYQGALLLNLEAVFTVMAGILIGRERLGWRGGVGAAGVVLAGVIVSLRSASAKHSDPEGIAGEASLLGVLAVIAACISWALDNTVSRPLAQRDPRQVAMVKGLVAGAGSVALGLPAGLTPPSAAQWLGLAMAGTIGLGLSLVLYLLSLRHVGIAMTGALFALSTPISFALSIGCLGERPGVGGAAALALAAGATALLVTDTRRM